jgi:putative membrane protein
MKHETVLRVAQFQPRLRSYWFIGQLLVQASTVVGVVLMPFWTLGLGGWYNRRKFDQLEATLTSRSLTMKRGLLFRSEITVPLDKIQDVSLHHGPVLSACRLTTLRIDTATSTQTHSASLVLQGLVDPIEFRDAILEQRDRVTTQPVGAAETTETLASANREVLEEIRDSLQRIEHSVAEGLRLRGR